MTERFDWTSGTGHAPDGSLYIAEGAFRDAKTPEELTVPEGVAAIGEEAFWGCTALRRIVLPEGLTEIGAAAFTACGALEEVLFPTSLRRIGDGAFMYCVSLREAALPPTLEELGEVVFLGCEHLTRATLKSQNCVVGAYAFGGYFPDEDEREELWELPKKSYLREAAFTFPIPPDAEDPEKLMYSLLWCGEAAAREDYTKMGYLRVHIDAALRYILRCDRGDLLGALLRRDLLPQAKLEIYAKQAREQNRQELAAMLLQAAAQRRSKTAFDFEGEFAL